MRSESSAPIDGLTIIGGGSLGYAVAFRCLQQGIVPAEMLSIVEHKSDLCAHLSRMLPHALVTPQVSKVADNLRTLKDSALPVVMLCIKPQEYEEAVKSVSALITENTLVISPMAGVALERVAAALGNHPHIIRCMPNLGAMHGLSMTVYFCSATIGEKHKRSARVLFDALGRSLEVHSNELVDAATAVSGSGPAYMFYLVEKLEEAAGELGFTLEQSQLLVRQTLLAAHALLDQDGTSAKTLRAQVTSRGGTTEAAFKLFDSKDLGKILSDGIKQAFERSRALSNS